MDKYFDKFPKITYSNNEVVDITRRVALLDRVSKNPYIFYPYDISDHERADQLSGRYYDDSYKSWLIYLTNKITDPYYEWYMSEDEIQEFVDTKYGSFYKAQTKIKYYRNDWENKDPISLSDFDALPASLQKYWQPNYSGTRVINYTRKEIDWLASTNKIVNYTVSNTSFVADELVNIQLTGSSVGKGQVIGVSSNTVSVQHLYGTFYPSESVTISGSSYIYGTESKCNTVITAATSVANNISEEELVYWKAITYYDYEIEKNEYNKSVRLIDKDQSGVAVDNLRELMEDN